MITHHHSALIQALSKELSEDDTAVIITHLPRLYQRLNHLKQSFPSSAEHCIAIKSNPHPHLLKEIVEQGFGLEAASIEEVHRALKANCPSHRIVFDSPVKTRKELAEVAQYPNLIVNVNSLQELERIPKTALCLIGIRINPLRHTGSPELFSVGQNESKFGVPISNKKALIQAALDYPVRALHMHSGSQMRDLKAQKQALVQLAALAQEINQALNEKQITRQIEVIDIGGGLPSEPLAQNNQQKTQMQSYGEFVSSIEALQAFKLVTEFGQWVQHECGLAVSRIEYIIEGKPQKLFIHLGADFFTRDAYTQARAFPLSLWNSKGLEKKGFQHQYDIAGPLCFAGDYLARSIELPHAQEGDLLCIDHCGANTYSLWSRHCSRSIPCHWAWTGSELKKWSKRQKIEY